MKIQRDISKAKNELQTAEDLTGETQTMFRAYEQELLANNALDFDDLLEKPVRIFQQNPETLEKYASNIHYILIDEYQDTNVSQYMMVKLLGKRHGNVTAVGDDQQSIYKFRGSDFRNFLTFERDWQGATIVELGQNYRSTGTIVNAAAGVISHNEFQRPKRLWTENEEGEPVKVLGSRSADEEALRLVHHILTLRTQNQHNIAILYRTNAQSRALESALQYNGVPYVMFGGLKFYDRKEIKDIVSAIRYAVNPKDSISKDRIEKTFTKKIREALVAGLPRVGGELNPVEIIGYFMKTADYQGHLQSKSKNSEERMENIQELIKFATTFTDTPTFLERISLFESSEQPKTGGNGNNPVVLMTIHLAKGLEFDHICIAGVNDDTLPHRRSLVSKEDLEEERRLMYVAMTRAKKTLVVSFFGLASRFLGEIPPEFVEVSDASWRIDDEPQTNFWKDYDSDNDIYLD
jgi:DNA helicase-2/ATP-dependent DNA helicase PcrA